jgi:putative endonuclease
MYYVYVLKSTKDHKLYIGSTINLRERFIQHQKGKVPSTKKRCPLYLIYYEACRSEKDCYLREKSLKTGFGRAYLKRRLLNDS